MSRGGGQHFSNKSLKFKKVWNIRWGVPSLFGTCSPNFPVFKLWRLSIYMLFNVYWSIFKGYPEKVKIDNNRTYLWQQVSSGKTWQHSTQTRGELCLGPNTRGHSVRTTVPAGRSLAATTNLPCGPSLCPSTLATPDTHIVTAALSDLVRDTLTCFPPL